MTKYLSHFAAINQAKRSRHLIVAIAAASVAVACSATTGLASHSADTDSIGECQDCRPEFVEIPGASALGFTYASRNEITWREYGQAVRARNCAPPLALPERLDSTKQAKLRTTIADRRFATNVAVTGLSLADVECYISWLNEKTGLEHSLPTPEQWRFLAFGAAETAYPWGDSLGYNNALIGTAFDSNGYHKESYATAAVAPRVVGQLAPNQYGLNDVIGNAIELTSDCREWTPKRPDSQLRLSCTVLGGSTLSSPQQQSRPSAALRVIISQSYPDAYVGFRLVR